MYVCVLTHPLGNAAQTFVEDFDARGRKAAAVSAATSAASAAQAGAPAQAGGTVSGPSGTLVTRRGADMGPPISFYVKTDLKPSFTVHLRSRDTLGALKRKVSQIVERPPELLSVFIFETRELHDDDKTFYGTSSSQPFDYVYDWAGGSSFLLCAGPQSTRSEMDTRFLSSCASAWAR